MTMVATVARFESCEICGTREWIVAYQGRIRDGAVGRFKDGALVAECRGCGVQRLDESTCIPDAYYESDEYRKTLHQSVESEKALFEQDWTNRYTHDALLPQTVRGKVIADVGCGIGSFLDSCRGQAKSLIAVDPCAPYWTSLKARGYFQFGTTEAAVAEFGGKADLVVSVQVIEHVARPVEFLRGIRPLLNETSGELLITTPNRDDILMKLLPQKFPEFFYRSAHRWYFDMASLIGCARRAGFELAGSRFLQKYGMANTMQWLRDGKPKGFTPLDGIGPAADGFWKGYLEQTGSGDTLCLKLRAATAT
jgi:2-polyprenyl-3-methyl-5-hydroxy-6-metoxy-1,4-benzoquinol methylase